MEVRNFEVIDRRQVEEYKREHARYYKEPAREERACLSKRHSFLHLKVIVASVKDLGYKGRQIVPLEEHTKCKCDCRIKEEVIWGQLIIGG